MTHNFRGWLPSFFLYLISLNSKVAFGSSRNYYFSGSGQPSNYYLKETLMSWAIGGNKHVVPDPALKKYFDGFQDVLKNNSSSIYRL